MAAPTTYLYGIEPVRACLQARRRSLRRLLLKEGKLSPRLRELEKLARTAQVETHQTSAHEIATRSGASAHQGVALECGPLPTVELQDFVAGAGPRSSLVALDQVEDPQNLGGIVRTTSFLGVDALLTLRDKSAPLNATVSKASAGALERLPIVKVGNLSEALQKLKSEDYWAVGAEGEEGRDYRSLSAPHRWVLVLGNEGSGLRSLTRKRCDELVKIPGGVVGDPGLDSLNVNVAAGILLSHFLAEGTRSGE